MTPTDPTPRQSRRDSMLAFSIIFFCVGLLTFMLGWADGVRHDRTILHVPENGGWLIATGILVALAFGFLVWSRSSKRS